MPKNINTFVTCHLFLRRNMSHFEKIEYFCMRGGVKFFKHGFIFEVREKSSHVNLRNAISKIYTREFSPKFKNEAVFEKTNTAYHSKVFNFFKI